MAQAKRENGNARLQGWIRVGLVVLALVASGYGGYVTLGGNVRHNSGRIEKNEAKADANEKCLIGIQKDIDYIKIALDKNATTQQEILREIRKK